MSDWAPQPIRDLIESEWPGEWGTEPAPLTPGVVVYRSTDIDDAGHLNEMDGGAYRSIPAGKLVAKQLRPGDILLEASGGTPDRPVGRVALFAGMRDEPAMSSNFLRTLRPKKSVDCHFACWALLNLHEQPAIWRYQQQTTGIINLKTSDYLGHEVLVPSLARQRRIAEILSTVDEAIEQTEKLIAKHQQIKAGLMHDLFTRGLTPDGHLRPSHTKAPHLYKDSTLGPIPKEWEPTAVGASVLGIDAGKSPDCPDRPAAPDEWGVLKVGAVNPMGLQANENKVVLDQGLWNPALLVRPGDLLLSRANTVDLVGLVCYVMDVRDGLMLSDKTLRLRPNASRVSVSFLFWILQDQTIRRQIANLATGTSGSMKNISQGGVRSLAFARPDLEEQGRLTSRLSAAAAREAALAVSAEKLKGLRLALMHDLLTGAVPAPIPEAEDG